MRVNTLINRKRNFRFLIFYIFDTEKAKTFMKSRIYLRTNKKKYILYMKKRRRRRRKVKNVQFTYYKQHFPSYFFFIRIVKYLNSKRVGSSCRYVTPSYLLFLCKYLYVLSPFFPFCNMKL